jgi:hypothetical protein
VKPFREFRVWARDAPSGERALTTLGVALAIVAVAWLLVPGDSGRVDSATSDGTGVVAGDQAGAANGAATPTNATGTVAGATGGVAGGGAASGAAAGGATAAAGSATGGAGGCVSPPGSAKGITATEIHVAATLVNIVGPAANSLFGVPPPADQRADFEAVFNAVNKAGGVACRKIVPHYFNVNPVDQSDMQQKCLQAVEAGVFAVIDSGGYAQFPQKICYAQHKIPFFGNYFFAAAERDKFYPYLFELSLFDTLYKDTVFALRDRGFFKPENGFKKLGFPYRDCFPQLIDDMKDWFHQAGVTDAQLVPYSVGCPSVFASPSDVAQAVLEFRTSGVTNVVYANFLGDFANFTRVAEQQGFRPKYGLPDDALISVSYGSQRPDANNINGAIAITASRNGEERTPGMTPTAGTAKCDAIYKAAGRPSTYEEIAVGGNICDEVWMFQAAVNNAAALRGDALAAGLQRAKSIDFAFPQGPNDFTGPRETTGGQFWRTAQFKLECQCWQVLDREFRRGY